MATKRSTGHKVKAAAGPEAKLGVELPAAYAAFLAKRRPKGAGNLLTVAQILTYERPRLGVPFPFTPEDVARILAARARGEDAFLEPEDTIGGVLPIADGGCNDVTYLVLDGPLRGSVWSSGDPGWLPHARPDGTLLGFQEWYDTVADEPAEPPAKVTKAAKGKQPPPLVIDPAAYQLNLRDRGLTNLPDEVGDMTKVALVYLGGNALTSLPRVLLKHAERLLALELGPNPLGKLEDDELGRFTRLTHLDVTGTKLTRLPEAVDRLPLRELNLGNNPQLDFAQVLAVVKRIPTLRWLYLHDCALSTVPSGIFELTQLERLYLGGNALETLPDELAALKLELLGLTDNHISKIPDVLVPRVQNVYFAGNPGARNEKKRFDAVRRGFVMLG